MWRPFSFARASLLALGLALAAGCGGALPKTAAASKAVEAPPPPALPTCLVLSVGGPAGIAHLGAIEALREARVEVSCVVVNSMGSLVGAVYATEPAADTTARFRGLLSRYVAQTKQEAGERALVGGLFGAILFGPIGALASAGAGAVSTNKIVHKRLVSVLDGYLGGVSIEALPIPYETSFIAPQGSKIAFFEAKTGNLAQAVGASVANPLIFPELDVRLGGPIDPGLDRVAAVPVEQACASFPEHRILAINVMPEPAFYSARMTCPLFELPVPVPEISPAAVFSDPAAFEQVVAAGRDITRAWLSSPAGQSLLATARRTQALACPDGATSACTCKDGTLGTQNCDREGKAASQCSCSPTGPALGFELESSLTPTPYVIRITEAELGPTKPGGLPWDGPGGGGPDVFVTVTVRGQGTGTASTALVRDTTTPRWDQDIYVTLARGDSVLVSLTDKDLMDDDLIGTFDIVFDGKKSHMLRAPALSIERVELTIEPE